MNTRLQRLQRVIEFSHELTSTISLEPLLHKIVEAAAELTDSEMAGLMLYDQADGNLHFLVSNRFSDQLVNIPVPLAGSVAGAAFTGPEPVVVPDVRLDPRYYKKVEEAIGVKAYSLVAVPLQFQERRIGVLEVENKRNRFEFTPDDIEILSALAAQATIAIENARLVEALEEARTVLEERVVERTATLSATNVTLKQEIAERTRTEETLQQYAAELKIRNQDLDAFAHTVAHDLKDPLNTIIGYAEFLVEAHPELPGPELESLLATIARVGRKMDRITTEIMLLAGIRQMGVDLTPLNMAGIVTEVHERLGDIIADHQAEIILPKSWPKALGYGPWVEEVWVNYISNAIKYGGSPPRLELGASRHDPNFISFWVRDWGSGVDPQRQADLFTPFKRLDQVRVTGQGLGLSIVRRIVEKLGGQVGVRSTGVPGEGSTFYFTLRKTLSRTPKRAS